MADQDGDTYEDGAADAWAIIMRAMQETLPAPHNDPAEPSEEFLAVQEAIFDTLQDVAEGRVALFDVGDDKIVGEHVAAEAQGRANEILARDRRTARAIITAIEGEAGE
jgi:hypothetical protein